MQKFQAKSHKFAHFGDFLYLCTMKVIVYKNPIDYMRGNLSGRQSLEYGSNDGKAYEQPTGKKTAANNYQPRLIAKVLRAPFASRKRYFQVRTRQSVNLTEAMKHNLALMGGVGAIFAAIVSDKTSGLYIACDGVRPNDMTLRAFLAPLLRAGLDNKDADIVIADGVAIANPWIDGGTGSQVTIPQAVLVKFAGQLGYAEISPYSSAATEALKAAFNAEQWQIISNYGFSHPEIVPYMNAYAQEDAKIAYSLVEGIGVRGLITDGSAWLDTGWTATGGMTAKFGAKILNNRTYYFGSHNTSEQGATNYYNRNQFYIPTVGTNVARYNVMDKTQNEISNKIVWGDYNEIEVSAINGTGKITVNGTSNTFSFMGILAPLNSVVLFYYYYFPNMVNSEGTGCSYLKLWDKDSNQVRDMIPFKRSGVMGMIDLLTGTFYGNANSSGTFTELIETTA